MSRKRRRGGGDCDCDYDDDEEGRGILLQQQNKPQQPSLPLQSVRHESQTAAYGLRKRERERISGRRRERGKEGEGWRDVKSLASNQSKRWVEASLSVCLLQHLSRTRERERERDREQPSP